MAQGDSKEKRVLVTGGARSHDALVESANRVAAFPVIVRAFLPSSLTADCPHVVQPSLCCARNIANSCEHSRICQSFAHKVQPSSLRIQHCRAVTAGASHLCRELRPVPRIHPQFPLLSPGQAALPPREDLCLRQSVKEVLHSGTNCAGRMPVT